MKLAMRAAFCAALVLSVAFASEESAVPSLTADTFDKAIAGDLTLVKFFAPWCGHCKSMAEPYKEAAEALKGKAVLAEVDATIEKELASKYGVQGFPTLKLFAAGEELSEYKGARDKESFIKYIERAMLPSVDVLLDTAAVKEYLSKNEGKTVYFATKLEKLVSAYKKQSMSMRDTLPDGVAFASVPDASTLSEAKGTATVEDTDSILVVRDDRTTDAYTGTDAAALDKFVKLSSVPLLGELSRGNAEIYTELGIPMVLLFQDPKAKKEEISAHLVELAKKYRGDGKLAFAWIDAVELKSFMDHLGITDAEVPIAIYEFDTDAKWTFDGAYDKTKFAAWIDDFATGKLEPTRKSEAIPETNDEAVKVVVGDSWETVVQDESKDVLIEQYAPWCGHCKALEPKLKQVAEALKNVDTIVIAKMDATVNDAPKEFKAKGFPTMHFFPAGGKKPIEYTGGRDPKDFIDFFKKHATHKIPDVEIPEAKEEPMEEEEVEEEAEEAGEEAGEGEKEDL